MKWADRFPALQSLIAGILNIEYHLQAWRISLEQKERGERPSFDPFQFQSSTSSVPHQEIRPYLLRRLCSFPYWEKGHVLLGILAIKQNDLALAYAEARAVEHLNPKSSQGALILGLCYVRKGEFQKAYSFLQQALEQGERSPSIYEEIAACLIPLQDFDGALQALHSIPLHLQSAHVKAALEYVRGKIKEPNNGPSHT